MIDSTLSRGWQFKVRDPEVTLPADFASASGWQGASVPGSVQQDLLRLGQIPDPYLGLNEQEVQWVGRAEWLYRLTFVPDEALLAQPHLELQFGGLDTLCTVWLNGEPLLESRNMFVPRAVDVKGRIVSGENTLQLHFASVLEAGHALEALHGRRAAWNGDRSRVYIRKAQYHYGWDWGPVLLTAGPWKPVTLRGFRARVEDVYAPSEVTPDLTAAFIPVQVTLGGDLGGLDAEVRLLDPDGGLIAEQRAQARPQHTFSFEVEGPRLWYPSGQGAQPLYTVEVLLREREWPQGAALDRCARRIGLRRLRVVQEPVAGEPGSSFTFEVNNRALFIGGANWIPEDLLLGRVTPEQYRERLTQARDGHLNMVRVWGGGLYEQDVFYDLCDELGLLVWQDFMFACGMYPAHPEFLQSVQAEAEAAVRRLRHHPSLAIWAGNNEDYAIAESQGAAGPGSDGEAFPARAIYEQLLPGVCGQLDPQRLYWPGSPWGGVNSADPTVGDRHSWEVWHGQMAPYQHYGEYQARFVSEFGMQSAPALSTIEAYAPEEERFPESRTLVHHNKASGPGGEPDGHRRLAVYLADNLKAYRDLGEYVYNTQFVQAEAMRYAYRDFRRRFEHPGKYAVSGALVWQLNDCWPVSSWAIIDSRGIAKPAYYTIRRELSPLAVGLRRDERRGTLEVWVSSAEAEARTLTLTLFAYTLGGELARREVRSVRALPARVTPLAPWTDLQGELVYFAELERDGSVVSRGADFPEPYKYHHLAHGGLRAEYLGDGTLRLVADRPTKGVWLDAGVRVSWDDNFLDLRPGEERIVTAPDLHGRPVQLRALELPPVTVALPTGALLTDRPPTEAAAQTAAQPVER